MNKQTIGRVLFGLGSLWALAACGDLTGTPPAPKSTVVMASGDITAKVNEFRALSGDPVNQGPNSGQTTGRREVNWDGVATPLLDVNGLPTDFFNPTDANAPAGRKRGLVYINTGASNTFRVSSKDFSDLEPTYAAQFDAFSNDKTFAYVTNPVTQVVFKVAGTTTDAFVRGFGVVFSDVDTAGAATLEFFSGDKSLGVFQAPARSGGTSFSFLGVYFPDEKVTRVKITSGKGKLGAGLKDITDGGANDLVVMDDFFYDEPKVIQ